MAWPVISPKFALSMEQIGSLKEKWKKALNVFFAHCKRTKAKRLNTQWGWLLLNEDHSRLKLHLNLSGFKPSSKNVQRALFNNQIVLLVLQLPNSFDSSKMYSLYKQLNTQVAHKHTIKPNEWLTLHALRSFWMSHQLLCMTLIVCHTAQYVMAESQCCRLRGWIVNRNGEPESMYLAVKCWLEERCTCSLSFLCGPAINVGCSIKIQQHDTSANTIIRNQTGPIAMRMSRMKREGWNAVSGN